MPFIIERYPNSITDQMIAFRKEVREASGEKNIEKLRSALKRLITSDVPNSDTQHMNIGYGNGYLDGQLDGALMILDMIADDDTLDLMPKELRQMFSVIRSSIEEIRREMS